MATIMHGESDPIVDQLKGALEDYEKDFDDSRADIYRQNAASVRIRVIDKRFANLSRAERYDRLYQFLAARVEENAIADVSVLLALTPGELDDSLANLDFEKPLHSQL